MRNFAVIGIAGVAGFALIWLLLARVSLPPPASAPATKVSAPTPTAAKPKETPPTAASVAAPSAATPAVAEPPIAPANPAAAGAVPAEPTKPKPDAAESATDEEDSASAQQDTDDESDSTEEDSQSAAIDVDRAADLLADWMARQDTAADDNAEIASSIKELKAFDQESADSDWSGPTAQQIEATLDEWLAALPDEVRDHVDIIHVECRETLCQILAADDDPASQNERAQASQEWQQAIATLPQQPWWNEFGFVDLTTAVNNDEADGFVLYQTYLRREATPPE